MRLTPWEEERLLIFTAAELARRHRSAGLLLNAPEAVALICDAMLEAARAGADYAGVEAAGRFAVASGDVLPGVPALIDDVRLEVLFGDGARLVVLVDPLGVGAFPGDGPGAVHLAPDAVDLAASDRDVIEIVVRSESKRLIRVSSHYPFHRVNSRLLFDRHAARGYRLDLPAGASERWAAGESRTVRLVRYRGTGGDRGATT